MLRIHFWVLLLLLFSWIPVMVYGQQVSSAQREPSLDVIFQRNSGWTGGDADYSISLGNGRAVWLFGDSWIGRVEEGKHVDSSLVKNVIAIQERETRNKTGLEFHWQKREKPGAFFKAEKGWFWPLHGVRTAQGLFIFLYGVDKTDDPSVFGFKSIGSFLAHVPNPDDPVNLWKISCHSLPFFRFTPKRELLFGASVVRKNGWLYVYGTDDLKYDHQHKRGVLLARVAEEDLLNFHKWRFWNGREWKKHFVSARPLFVRAAKEFSVSLLSGIERYVAIYTDYGLSPEIKARFSLHPQGPFSEALTVYHCPENDHKTGVFTYAAKGHPWMSSRDDELIVSYTTNCTDFFQLAADATLYWPLFVRLKFQK